MPRVYVRKKQPKYTEESLNKLIDLIKDKKISVKIGSTQFNIPLSTIYDRLAHNRGPRGRQTILSIAEEEFLVKLIKLYQEWQQPVSKPDILELTKTYMKQLGKKTRNQDGNELKLNDWYYGFLARWSTELKT
ncbi:unnamed protein product [Didymodactylos carnosus]|uniref:HTH psq-type domain-containing protein n=1 Tax=Didymodactylos carnosus TaxID=1234261 RepID=A0A815WH37_9BILA|nr:unnamed protein product [Didymodactylos carnosus]CAF1545840.1 unnamed protein product [Didymodactylos carnosus]CAF3796210.1 unnamed protein product [Didymodactylos carnosus]CAF4406586.1 unnamed protein product [Didymodactylos carnosus]